MEIVLVPGPKSTYISEQALKEAWNAGAEWEVISPDTFAGNFVTKSELQGFWGFFPGELRITVMYGRNLEFRATFRIYHQK